MRKANKNIKVVKREYHIFRFFRIRKETKDIIKELNKKGFGYFTKEIRDLMFEKGYKVAVEPEENGLYRVETN